MSSRMTFYSTGLFMVLFYSGSAKGPGKEIQNFTECKIVCGSYGSPER